jgi:phosphoribosyl 1,2-cyclic phosphodiesterase
MHSCLLVQGHILIDYGLDWLGKFAALRPEAILLTHAHPDHAGGLKSGVSCDVYATAETWDHLRRYPIHKRITVAPERPWALAGNVFEAFAVEHSLIAPAVGYRITRGATSVFYVPDLVSIHERHKAMSGVTLYIGDAASITRPLLRRRARAIIGHASMRDQLNWCHAEGVQRAIFTHCGSQVVKSHGDSANARVAELGMERGVKVAIAHDGLEITVSSAGIRFFADV